LFVLFYPAALSLAATLLYVVVGGDWPDFSRPLFVDQYPLPPEARQIPFLFFLPFVFLQQTLVGSSMGEELGWRGYLLPRLQRRFGALVASVVLGLIWGLWHLPLALTPGDVRSETFFGWTLLGLVAAAILFTWVYNNTRGSLLIALLFHTAINMVGLFLASPDIHPVLTLVISWVAPILLIITTRAKLGCQRSSDGDQVAGGWPARNA
jgi:membrane protease YdiL (CAAX protease family)